MCHWTDFFLMKLLITVPSCRQSNNQYSLLTCPLRNCEVVIEVIALEEVIHFFSGILDFLKQQIIISRIISYQISLLLCLWIVSDTHCWDSWPWRPVATSHLPGSRSIIYRLIGNFFSRSRLNFRHVSTMKNHLANKFHVLPFYPLISENHHLIIASLRWGRSKDLLLGLFIGKFVTLFDKSRELLGLFIPGTVDSGTNLGH